MEAIDAAEDIPKIVPVQSYPNGNNDADEEQPSSSIQPIVNTSTVEHTRTTNIHQLEFACLLLFFSFNLSSTVFQNQILYQTCMLNNYNESTCDTLTNEKIPEEYKVNIEEFLLNFRNHVNEFISLFIGIGRRIRRKSVKNINGANCFGKYCSSVHELFNWSMVG